MDVVYPVNELQQQLKEAGQQLSSPPSSVSDLLHLLDKTKHLLTLVGQSPSFSMQTALVPPMGALIADELIKHSEIDVRISVASCLCEVARITAPEISYKDDIMKEIFQLNVLAFEQLSNMADQRYYKVIQILESVAKVKSCLVMLDLECDDLVTDMFELFLSKIRINHPNTVFSDIETIMTSIIEESDEISIELLSLLISHVKKGNQIVSPASWKLAEKVLRNCFNTLKPYHETVMKLINSNLDDYAEVVTLLCQVAHENEHVVTRSTRTNSTHKRDPFSLENGISTKKQKYIDKNQFKGKEQGTSRRGRPKKIKNSLNQENNPNLVQNPQVDISRSRLQEKRQSSKSKGNIKNSGSLYNGSGGKDIPKKWGQDLVGHMIKVWWPLDEMHYEGVVSFYDPLDDKYKVLYADGDEELLDLSQEKWRMIDEFPPDQVKQQGKVTDTSSPFTPARPQKQKGKRKLESLRTQEDNSSSPKSPPPADSSKTTDVICDVDSQKDNLVPSASIFCALELTEKTIDNVEKHGKSYPSEELQEKSSLELNETTPRLKKTDMEKHGESYPSEELQEKSSLDLNETTQGLEKTDVEKHGESYPSEELQEKSSLELNETTQGLEKTDLEKHGESYPSEELQEKSSLELNETTQGLEKTDVEKHGESYLSEELQEKSSLELNKKTQGLEKTDVEKHGESYPSEELQEKSSLESNETTQRLEKNDNLVCGT